MLSPSEAEARSRWIVGAPRASRGALLEQQARWLRQIVCHASERVPYYRDLYRRANIRPEQLDSVAALQGLPVTTREELRAASPASLLAEGVDPGALLVERSSGASGVPILVRHTPRERDLYLLLRARTFALLSPQYGGRLTYVGLDSRTEEEKRRTPPGKLTVIECRQPVERILQALLASRPDVLIGYPGVLSEVAQEASPAALQQIRPRLTVTSGEVLTPSVRQLLLTAFAAPVTTTYASTEFFWMGGECAQTGALHLLDDSLVLEVVDDDGRPVLPGQTGNVVATSLHSFAQPFIRYRIGDVAVQGRAPMGGAHGCSCGSPFSTLAAVQGRALDYLVLPSGSKIHSYTLSLPLRDNAPFLQRYQIVQEAPDHFRLRIACWREPEAQELVTLRGALTAVLGPDPRIDFELMDHLPREESGKFRLVVCKVKH